MAVCLLVGPEPSAVALQVEFDVRVDHFIRLSRHLGRNGHVGACHRWVGANLDLVHAGSSQRAEVADAVFFDFVFGKFLSVGERHHCKQGRDERQEVVRASKLHDCSQRKSRECGRETSFVRVRNGIMRRRRSEKKIGVWLHRVTWE